MKKLTSCVLVFLMILGTCTTSFASLLTDAEIAYVQDIVDNVKAEINDIIDVAENGTDEEKMAKIDEYVEATKNALVNAGFSGDVDAIEAAIRAEIAEIVAIASEGDAAAAEEKADAYIEYVKSLFDLTEEENAFVDDAVDKIKDEIGEIAGIVDAQDDEAAKAKIDAYVNFIKDAIGVTADDEAKIAEIVDDVTALIDEIKGLSAEDAKAIIDGYVAELKAKASLEYAKLGHKPYAKESGDLYVAIGANVEGIGRDDAAYYELVADEYDIDYSLESDDVADADLITYQVDAADVLLGALETEANWEAYFTAEQLAVVDTVWETAAEVIAMDWEEVGALHYAGLAAYIKDVVLEKLPAEITVNEEKIDNAIAFVATILDRALALAEAKKDEAVALVDGVDEQIIDLAEKLAFAVVSYVVDTKAAIEEIQAINPDATLVVLGMYNNLAGVEVTFNGTTVDAGEYFAYAVEATNLYYSVLAASNGGFAFVNIDEAEVNGATIAVTDDLLALVGTITTVVSDITANADGHEYIKDEILKAFVCDYSVYEKLDKTYHTVKCSLCGDAKKEKHTFSGKTCTLCGYVKSTGGALGGGTISRTEKDPETTTTSKVDKFTDISKEAWYYDYVKAIVEKDFMKGTTEKEFAPDATLTRGMFVTVLYRIEGEPLVEDGVNFTDVADDQYYANAVKWASANGIVKGITETEFAPNVEVTREQMAAMLTRYADYKKLEAAEGDVSYTDDAEVSEYAKEAVKIANKLGILIGNTDGSFAPKKNATRAEAAALFVRLLDVLAK